MTAVPPEYATDVPGALKAQGRGKFAVSAEADDMDKGHGQWYLKKMPKAKDAGSNPHHLTMVRKALYQDGVTLLANGREDGNSPNSNECVTVAICRDHGPDFRTVGAGDKIRRRGPRSESVHFHTTQNQVVYAFSRAQQPRGGEKSYDTIL